MTRFFVAFALSLCLVGQSFAIGEATTASNRKCYAYADLEGHMRVDWDIWEEFGPENPDVVTETSTPGTYTAEATGGTTSPISDNEMDGVSRVVSSATSASLPTVATTLKTKMLNDVNSPGFNGSVPPPNGTYVQHSGVIRTEQAGYSSADVELQTQGSGTATWYFTISFNGSGSYSTPPQLTNHIVYAEILVDGVSEVRVAYACLGSAWSRMVMDGTTGFAENVSFPTLSQSKNLAVSASKNSTITVRTYIDTFAAYGPSGAGAEASGYSSTQNSTGQTQYEMIDNEMTATVQVQFVLND